MTIIEMHMFYLISFLTCIKKALVRLLSNISFSKIINFLLKKKTKDAKLHENKQELRSVEVK